MIPEVSPTLVGAFARYARWYIGRSFRAVRISAAGAAPDVLAARPIVVCLNHPSWWDPLIGLTLARSVWPGRRHYAAIDADALRQYRFLSRAGCFGIEKQGYRGASTFLRTSLAILGRPDSALWVTGQGEFVDPRTRPTLLRPGLGHLMMRARGAIFIPLALEYPFWQERFPEALCRFGAAIFPEDEDAASPMAWTARIQASLESAQDALAAEAIGREPAAFRTILRGRAGVGLFYDSWRRFRATLAGADFRRQHGDDA